MKKIITLILLLSWMAVIFSFSRQDGAQSGSLSRDVAYWIAKAENQLLQQEKSEADLERQTEAMQFVIRKGAHMSEYALLAILFLMHFSCYRRLERCRFFLAWICGTLFAATDEIHQLFIPGRAGQFRDVCLDSAGSLLGIGLAALVLWLAGRCGRTRKGIR